MVDNIFGNRFYGYRIPAWHDLGMVSQKQQTAIEAHESLMSEKDFLIHKRPLAYRNAAGEFVLMENRVAIVRDMTEDDPGERVFGIVDPDYGLLQNKDIIEAVQPLSERWPVETYGFLGNGETLFLSLDAGMREVKGEPLDLFFLVTDGRTGRDAMRVAFTPVRVVCQNTLVTGLKASVVSTSIVHTRGVKRDMDMQMRLIAAMEKAEMDVLGDFERLMEAHITPEEASDMFDGVYPLPQRPAKLAMGDAVGAGVDEVLTAQLEDLQHQYELMIARTKTRRDAVGDLFQRINDEHTFIANTPWAAYNAVVEFEDYRRSQAAPAKTAESILFGERANIKAEAFRLAMGML